MPLAIRKSNLSLCGFPCFNFHNQKLSIRHAKVCGCMNSYFWTWCEQITTTVHILCQRVQLWYSPSRISNDNPQTNQPRCTDPRTGLPTGWIKDVRLTKPVSGLQIRSFCMLMPKCNGHFRPVCAITTGEDSNSACESTSQKSSRFSGIGRGC